MERIAPHTGGCQCGAVRYALHAEPYNAHVCHCRMCQKAFGSVFAPLANVKREDFAWTRGAPAHFRSSEAVQRGFCRDCGTPLTYDVIGDDHITISIGSLDDPGRVPPQMQYGIEGRVSWFGSLPGLPGDLTTEQEISPDLLRKLASRQHPDHDTEDWPPVR